MLTLDLKELGVQAVQRYLQNAIAPRPICFASTVDKEGRPNLSPFSFFNLFSSNPPVVVFSPAYSGRTGAPKDTLLNVLEVPEVVINVVTYDMVHQTSLASSPFARGINEFEKARFTPLASELVKPARVKESPVQLECRVMEVKELGKNGGAGNLVICEVLRMHIDDSLLNEDKTINPRKLDLVGRMGDNWYCRASGDAMFEVKKPITTIGIGIDGLPEKLRQSTVLSGNNLGLLASVEQLPTRESLGDLMSATPKNLDESARHRHARELLEKNQLMEAWAVLLGD